jgi:hypothetical protein
MLAVKDKRQQIRSGQSRQAAAVLQSFGATANAEQPTATKDRRERTICTRTQARNNHGNQTPRIGRACSRMHDKAARQSPQNYS